MIAFRALLLIAIWCCSLAQAAELTIAIWDPTQIAMQGRDIPRGTPGFGLVAVNDDIAREICRRINARCTLRYVSFAEILPGVESRHFDMGFGNFLRTPEREQRVAYSDAVWHSSSRLVGSSSKTKSFAEKLGHPVTIDNLRDARVVGVDASMQLDYIKRIASEQRLSVVGTPSPTDAIEALRNDNADFALLSVTIAYMLLSGSPMQQLEFVGPATADRGLGGSVHIILSKQNALLLRSVNSAIAAIRADGTFHRIARQYFPLGLD
jgi:ABC-type amino acid transport substrate-binding protein